MCTYGDSTSHDQCVHLWTHTIRVQQWCKGTLQCPSVSLPPVSRDFRSSSVSVTSSVVFLIEPTAEELPSSFRPAVRLPPSAPFILFFIFHYGVILSRHLSSYFPSYHFHFIYLFHCPIVVYISTLSDRKVPILFFLDFLSGTVSPFLFSLRFNINILDFLSVCL